LKTQTLFLLFITLCGNGFSQQENFTLQLLFSFGSKGDGPGQFQTPAGISTDPNGNIYVADTGNNRIQKFDHRGNLLKFIGGFGWESEQFQRPVDICAENGLDVFVADYDNNRIERYDKDLNWITSYRNNENLEDNLQFAFPQSVNISIHGDLFIVDGENNRVLKLNTFREPEISFGGYDWGQGALTAPVQICISKDDKIYVSDQDAGSVFVFDYYGNYLFEIGRDITPSPQGLCLDENNNLYITDSELDQIFIFDSAGHKIIEYGSRGEKLGAFQNPGDIAVFQNKIYVTDMDNHRVQVFQLYSNKNIKE
jgi:DNA-binding beta-propeller fold protein YncE